jgi:hypothetical protein
MLPLIKPVFYLGRAQASMVRENDLDTRESKREVSEDREIATRWKCSLT